MVSRIVFALLALLAPAGLLAWLWGPQIVHGLTLMFVGGAALLIVLTVIAVLILIAFLFEGSRVTPIAGTLAALVFAGGLVSAFTFSYNTDKIYTADVKTAKTSVPDFAERAPYDVAVAAMTRNLGDTTGIAIGAKALVDEGTHGVWSTLVLRRGAMLGYEAVQTYNVPLYGAMTSKATRSCEFNTRAAGQRVGGFLPHTSLDYRILGAVPLNTTFTGADAYAYCDGDTPIVVAPLKTLSGFWTPTWTSSGAAVYNGQTGALTIEKDTSDLPGPVYPISLAASQRGAMNATEGFWDYFFGRTGFETTDGDEGDPNTGNTSELDLRFLGQKDGAYVTPLTPRGDSTSVIAMATIDSTTATQGTRNPVTVYRYSKGDARQANTSIVQSMKSKYSWMADWASGLDVFEIVPTAHGSWVASIGQSQSVVYRAVVNADGNATLYDSTGKEITRTSGTTPVADPAAPGSGPVTAPAADSDLSKLTPEQLRVLADAILDEMAARATK